MTKVSINKNENRSRPNKKDKRRISEICLHRSHSQTYFEPQWNKQIYMNIFKDKVEVTETYFNKAQLNLYLKSQAKKAKFP